MIDIDVSDSSSDTSSSSSNEVKVDLASIDIEDVMNHWCDSFVTSSRVLYHRRDALIGAADKPHGTDGQIWLIWFEDRAMCVEWTMPGMYRGNEASRSI